MKKLLLLFVMTLLPVVASADAVEINGIYYNLIPKGNAAEVTRNPNKYAGEVTIPESVEYEGKTFFVTAIVNKAFNGCEALTSVTIPNTVTRIGDDAFYGCTGMTAVTIPNSVKTIGSNAFMYCYGLTDVNIPNSLTSIESRTFAYCYGLTAVTIPSSVTSIGGEAFMYCTGLTAVTIPNSVTSIGYYAFSNCGALTSIAIPNSVTELGNGVFCASGLTSVTIPNSLTEIGDGVFLGCTGLTSVTIPNSVTDIRSAAFRGCTGLNSISIPSSVTSIESGAFQDCSGLTAVHISDLAAWLSINFEYGRQYGYSSNPLTYAHHLYLNGEELSGSITIPSTVTSISNGAFMNCAGITSVIIPNSVTSIGELAFYECSGLTSVDFGNSVASIGNTAFHACTGLTSVTIPNSVTSIGYSAFSGCSGLTSVTIGSSVRSIDSFAFADCPDLTDVYCYGVTPPSAGGTSVFQNNYIEYVTLHVPAASVSIYKATEPWKNFNSIVALEGEVPEVKKCEKPTISYQNGELTFSSATEGAEFVYEITDTDIKKGSSSKVQLSATYHISVYATKLGYLDSDAATATLCWIDVEPSITDGVANVRAKAVLIQSNGGTLSISGTEPGTPISVYDTAGHMVGSAEATGETTTVSTQLRSGQVAIVRIGEKAVKVAMK